MSKSKIDKIKSEGEKIGTWGYVNPYRVESILKYGGRRILDVGCSKGAYVDILLNKDYEAYGMDIFKHDEWEKNGYGKFTIADINSLPYKDGSFDTVCAFEVLEHIEDVDNTLKELYRVTGKNIILSVPNCIIEDVFRSSGLIYHHWVDRTHINFFTEETLKQKLLDSGFKIDSMNLINPIAPEILCLSGWRIPKPILDNLAGFLNKAKIGKRYYMTILVVATKVPGDRI